MLRLGLMAGWACSWAVGAAFGSEGWGPLGAWQVRRTVGIPATDPKQPAMRDVDCVYVAFPTAEFLQPDGADLRVAVDGKAAPFKIVDIGYGGYVRLVAGIPEKADRLHVYYGNPAAKAPASDWEPRRGAWLETRQFRGGECRTLQEAREAWAKSGPRFGAGPVGEIFQGYNPFGPSDNFMSLYKGWLVLDKDATATLAVVADDLGFLLVEDKLVASKTEWGEMPHGKQFSGEPMTLSKGIHPITLCHVQRGGSTAAGAAWWMPGMKRGEKFLHFQIIPAAAYAPLRYGTLLDYEVRGQPLSADFSYANDGDAVLDDGRMIVRFAFRDMSRPAPRALQCQPLWDFGDGVTSTTRDPSHVYMRPGEYAVALTLQSKGGEYKVRQKIRVGPGYERATRAKWDKLEDYLPILQEYQFEKMATEDLLVAARAFEQLEDTAGIIAACGVLFKRPAQLDDAAFVHHCLLLGRHLRDFKPKDEKPEDKPEASATVGSSNRAKARAEEAVRVFAAAEQRTKDVRSKARLANEKGDVYYWYLNDLEKAEQEYTKALKTYATPGDAQVRLAQMRIGDLYRTKGDCQAALSAYQSAAAMPIHTRAEGVEAARRGSFPRTVEDYIARKLFKEAHEALDEWDWEFPTDKLAGYSSFLRARLALAEGNKKEAQKQAEELIRGNKESEYADDLLLFLTNFYVGEGQLDRALETAARLLKDYPASDLQEEAHLKRADILFQQGKFGEAAKEALDTAKGNEDSANAPKALLLAATAQARQKKAEDAIKTLERLLQKYPTTEQATAGLKMLKELRPK